MQRRAHSPRQRMLRRGPATHVDRARRIRANARERRVGAMRHGAGRPKNMGHSWNAGRVLSSSCRGHAYDLRVSEWASSTGMCAGCLPWIRRRPAVLDRRTSAVTAARAAGYTGNIMGGPVENNDRLICGYETASTISNGNEYGCHIRRQRLRAK